MAPLSVTLEPVAPEMSVPAAALYGASTQRAVLNFTVSGYRCAGSDSGIDKCASDKCVDEA